MRELFATIAAVAAEQHGRITTRELRAAGVDKSCAQRWLEDGLLHRVHRGVYAVGHVAPSTLADYVAAVLACGGGSRLSHAPCSHLLKLQRGVPPPPEVTVATTAHRRRPGIVIHRVRDIPQRDVAELHGIPIMTVPRTLLDLAPRLTPQDLARACHEA
ncbi:MAG: hypothetical protein QOE31_2197, partial [Solirubrobacteraceae bacterium]|nr:hypothetical protein [Solirubrobacteraceae bacterium]